MGVEVPAPESMIGALGAVPVGGAFGGSAFDSDPLQTTLFDDYGIEVPVFRSPTGGRIVRVSAHLYNEVDEYRRLGEALVSARAS
jgi:isopenicillin-N epimerase